MEEYGIDSFTVQEDGRLLFQGCFADQDSILRWILGFGDKAELLEPAQMRGIIKETAQKIGGIYKA